MKEKIIVAPRVNGNELLCSMAIHGVKSFNVRVCGATQLARMALLRSGISVKDNFVSQQEAVAIIAEAVKTLGIPYFGKTTYSDIRAITFAIYRMRTLVPGGNEEQAISTALGNGEFKEKNKLAMESLSRASNIAIMKTQAYNNIERMIPDYVISEAFARIYIDSLPHDGDFIVENVSLTLGPGANMAVSAKENFERD